MKFNFIRKGPEKWRMNEMFMISIANFIIGFALAWVLWYLTVEYVLSLAQ